MNLFDLIHLEKLLSFLYSVNEGCDFCNGIKIIVVGIKVVKPHQMDLNVNIVSNFEQKLSEICIVVTEIERIKRF